MLSGPLDTMGICITVQILGRSPDLRLRFLDRVLVADESPTSVAFLPVTRLLSHHLNDAEHGTVAPVGVFLKD